MCFSSTASFGAGLILSGIGVASLKKVKEPSTIPFASIPLIFAVQQFCEGFLWLALCGSKWTFLQTPMTYVFIFFAQIVWPFWVPYAVLQIETSEKRKRFLRIFFVSGLLVSTYLGYCLLLFGVEARLLGKHISYLQPYPQGLIPVVGVLYFSATVLPHFFSSAKYMWSLGTAVFISYLVTILFYEGYLISVWCFFASIISIAIFAVVYELSKTTTAPKPIRH